MKPQRDEDRVIVDRTVLDDLLQHRVRITIAVLLSRHDQLSFSRLKELLGETDGSLGAHLRKLEDAGYVVVRKEFQERRPVTWYRLAAKGRRALATHLQGMEQLIKQAGT
jgi:DNA-binding MarR family transcriptional regulator